MKVAKAATTTVPTPTSTTTTPPRAAAPAALVSVVNRLSDALGDYALSNERSGALYDQTYRVQMLDLGLPKAAQHLRLVMGWARTVVDVLAERMEPVTWSHADVDAEELAALWDSSGAGAAIPQAITDMMVYGIGFLSATAGNPALGEPRVLLRAHSATSTTATLDDRTGRVTEAITMHTDDRATVWLPDAIVEVAREHGHWVVVEAVPNRLGAVPMVAMPNAARAGKPGGRSEITPAIRSALMSATRALVAMDVNREFFAIPHRYLIGVAGDFVDADGQLLETWRLAARAMLKLPYDEQGSDIQVGEFSQVKAGPFLEQIDGLAKITAAEAGLPAIYLGVEGNNPSSADAIRMSESRLVRRTRARIAALAQPLGALAQLALAIAGGTALADTPRPRTVFADPATAAFSADADAWTKLMGAGAVPKRSATVWRRMGFTEPEIVEMQRDADRDAPLDRVAALDAALSAPGVDAYDPDDDEVVG